VGEKPFIKNEQYQGAYFTVPDVLPGGKVTGALR
jgi:hypothetical protein